MSENDVVWIEIYIPQQYRMQYSEFQIKRHIEILDEKAKKEVEGTTEEPELTELFLIVPTQEEAEKHNNKLEEEKKFTESVRLER